MNIGVFGFGTVGSGVVKILRERPAEMEARNGAIIHLKKICTKNLSQTDFKGVPVELFTENGDEIFNNPEIDTIVEVVGGTTAAKTIVETALKNGKNVVTANKALLSQYGEDLFDLAQKNGVQLLFEASVGGGIPIVRILRKYYTAGNISKISGILNGTCNYILSELEKGGKDYAEVLKEAQKLGFAEADPTFDVEGFDSAQKLSLLTALAFGTAIPHWEGIPRDGISHLLSSDFAFAKKMGKHIRLIARAEKTPEGVYLGVHPRLVPENSRLGNISGPDNGMLIEEPFLGSLSLVGAGAGSLPTATAIVSDLGEILRSSSNPEKKRSPLGFQNRMPFIAAPRENIQKATYFRVKIKDGVGVIAKISEIFAEEGISIDEIQNRHDDLPLAFVLHKAPLVRVENAAQKIAKLPFVLEEPLILMVEE
ncbi:MAG: homoserine dehydrogenase [Candidatus Peregrinibacteria bacterium]